MTTEPTDRTGTPRVVVSVSEPMATLRRMQGVLNGFWQTSELAYGYLLARAPMDFPDLEKRTVDLLGHIESQVWYPNNQGRIKRDASMKATLQQVRENTVHVYRAMILGFSSAFEHYLETRVAPLRSPRRWGPYVSSLAIPELKDAAAPVRLRTVLCADFCRLIRNRIVHDAFSVPTSPDSREVQDWKRQLSGQARGAGWTGEALEDAVGFAAGHVVGHAGNQVESARRRGKELPIEYFYMLFNFTGLDSLAFEIEEALQAAGDRNGHHVSRRADAVRRTDLVVGPASPAG